MHTDPEGEDGFLAPSPRLLAGGSVPTAMAQTQKVSKTLILRLCFSSCFIDQANEG